MNYYVAHVFLVFYKKSAEKNWFLMLSRFILVLDAVRSMGNLPNIYIVTVATCTCDTFPIAFDRRGCVVVAICDTFPIVFKSLGINESAATHVDEETVVTQEIST